MKVCFIFISCCDEIMDGVLLSLQKFPLGEFSVENCKQRNFWWWLRFLATASRAFGVMWYLHICKQMYFYSRKNKRISLLQAKKEVRSTKKPCIEYWCNNDHKRVSGHTLLLLLFVIKNIYACNCHRPFYWKSSMRYFLNLFFKKYPSVTPTVCIYLLLFFQRVSESFQII